MVDKLEFEFGQLVDGNNLMELRDSSPKPRPDSSDLNNLQDNNPPKNQKNLVNLDQCSNFGPFELLFGALEFEVADYEVTGFQVTYFRLLDFQVIRFQVLGFQLGHFPSAATS